MDQLENSVSIPVYSIDVITAAEFTTDRGSVHEEVTDPSSQQDPVTWERFIRNL
jgi:hypothetical protein